MPLLEVVGNGFNVPPEQIGATAVKVGVMFGFIVMVSVVVVAHCPAAGVKVYVVVPAVAVLTLAGLHVPVMPLVDVACKVAAELFWQRGPIALKVGVISGLMVMEKVAVVAH